MVHDRNGERRGRDALGLDQASTHFANGATTKLKPKCRKCDREMELKVKDGRELLGMALSKQKGAGSSPARLSGSSKALVGDLSLCDMYQ